MWRWLFCLTAVAALATVAGAGAGAARLVCYVRDGPTTDGFAECTHLVYAGEARGDKLDAVLKEYRKGNPRLKIILRVSEVDKNLRTLLKSKHVQGLEVHDAHKSLNKTSVLETVESARSAISSSGGGPLFLALPAHPELLAKYYDLRTLVKKVDLMMVQTHALGMVKKMTYHPSRLSGLWDMMNTDSVVDLVVGLGAPASKVVISLPATARRFTLLNQTLSTPGSPALNDEPAEIDQAELCRLLRNGRWTLERDQDLSAPYAFKDKTWISFEDSSSVDVKGKYARVRGLAGLALHGADRDAGTPCGPALRVALAKVLNQQSRAPRAAVLRSLEHEILSAPALARAADALQVSPYRITQVVDSDGVIHSIREDTRTEFSCSRQGYYVHPRSCARFYRCVKFDQLSPEYTVFEFDCPAGLAFDSRYEVCVWPGSLPHSQACPGSSEIAPVPHTRFICPQHEGYYADPENCRWFFACLDHGKAPLTAYEFRCPFGLGFDAEKLKCDWPWLVPACGNIARYEAEAFGYSGAALSGAAGFQGQTADAINIAGHQSLVSGASLDNLVGIQSGFLTAGDALDSNFIASQELAGSAFSSGSNYQVGNGASSQGSLDNRGLSYEVGVPTSLHNNVGLVQPTKYTSGSIILDDYRLPTKEEAAASAARHGIAQNSELGQNYQHGGQHNGYNGYSSSYNSGSSDQKSLEYQGADYEGDNSGAYVHDPTGDNAEPYKHTGSPVVPYVHDDSGYKQSSDYYDLGRYSASQTGEGKYEDNSGQFVQDNSGAYHGTGSNYRGDYSGFYNADYTGSYTNDNSGKYVAGVYRTDGHIGSYDNEGSKATSSANQQYHGSYGSGNIGNYLADTKAYTGASHTLTAGAVNVGLVGKTTLVGAGYTEQGNYNGYSGATQSFDHGVVHNYENGHVPVISQPAVSINHVGTDGNNLDGYSFVTTPTSSGVPTTATPFAVTTSLPVTTAYKTTFVPDTPKSSIKQIFGYSQPAVTFVQPTVVAVQQYNTPKVQVTDYNQAVNYQSNYNTASQGISSESSGYHYSQPSIKFEDGTSYTTQAPIVVSTFKPQGFSHSQQTLHKVESQGYEYSTPTPVTEPPFKKLVAYTTGPSVSTYVQPTLSTYTPQAFSHNTVHKVENTYLPAAESGYEYNKPAVSFEPKTYVQYTTPQPAVSVQPVVSTYQPQVYSQQTLHNVDANQVYQTYSEGTSGYSYEKPASGYDYHQPSVKFEEAPKATYQYASVSSTPAPVISTYKPQSYSHQTYHKVETPKYLPPSTPVPNIELTYQQPAVTVYQNPILKYTEKVNPVTYVQPTAHSYSQQTIHKVESGKAYTPVQVGSYESVSYEAPKTVVQYTTAQPALQAAVSTYKPQVYSHQTLHKVEASKVNTYSPDTGSGYHYEQPAIRFEEAPKTVQYSTPAPVVSTYRPHSYSQQTVHKVEAQKFVPVSTTALPKLEYEQPAVSVYEHPILKYTQTITPAQPTAAVYTQNYQPIVHQHQVSHIISQPAQYETSAQQNLELGQGYSYSQPEIQRDIETVTAKSYSDASLVSHQVYHQSNENSQYKSGKDAVFVSSTPSTLAYEEHYTEYEAPKTHTYKALEYIPPNTGYEQSYTVSTESTPVIHHSSISHQTQEQYKAPEYVPPKTDYKQSYTVSTEQYKTPEHVPPKTDYQQSYTVSTEQYKTPEYVPPNTDYQQSYTVSTASTPVIYHSAVSHQTQEQYDYKPVEYSQQYDTVPVQQVSFSTSHVEQPKRIESVHLSSFPGTKVNIKYNQVSYQSPEIQVGYNAEEYLPPVVSTAAPVITSTYKPPTFSTIATTREYLPPTPQPEYNAPEYLPPQPKYTAQDYLPPKVENTYLPPSTTPRTIVKYTTQAPTYNYVQSTTSKSPEYLPPQEEVSGIVNFESFGLKNTDESFNIQYNPYQKYTVSSTAAPVQRKQNIVVQTAKSNLLGFGTVGPDAGLVSPVSYTTGAPVISSTYAPELVEVSSPVPVRRNRPKYVKSTTSAPYVESTTAYKAPEYLPPLEETEQNVNFESFGLKNFDNTAQISYNPYQEDTVVSTSAPVQRKQNIVVETAKSHLPGFGTIGPDAGLVSYTTSAPVVSSSESYSLTPKTVTSSYLPIKQELVEVSPVPARRTKPKVAVVTKINDFNPLLVRKLGAVCSCQSPVLVLKGRRPNVQVQQDYEDYSNDYEDGRGDISDNQWALRTARLQTPVKTVTTAPVVTSSFNPIIVPDDSFYQDYQESSENIAFTPKSRQVYSENYVSSTPVAVSTTEKVVRIRPRVKAVTVAPTYKTVLLKQEVAPIVKDSQDSSVDVQSFDRYGPGGLRSRDETLQGSVDCQRAGLFRHPKQCNKFYACRWDCTKQRFTLHVFNCPVQLSFDPSIGACNWPSQGPACQGDTLLTNTL